MATQGKPNILVIMGDDIGWFNPSIYNRGMMGYRTPNIDRIGNEGAMFTNWYGQQSCTAGRAAFITGQSPIRTGLTKVGLPGADLGLRPEDPTIAEILEPLGYTCGQFGKNHLGDKNEFLPTVHGFDEFFGNLYHLNLIPFFKGEETETPRKEFLYWNDDGQLCAVRVLNLKIVFLEQRHTGIDVWKEAFTPLRMPKVFNMRSDPFERGDESVNELEVNKLFFVVPAQTVVARWLGTFKDFPPRQKPSSFNIDEVVEKLTAVNVGGR